MYCSNEFIESHAEKTSRENNAPKKRTDTFLLFRIMVYFISLLKNFQRILPCIPPFVFAIMQV